MSGPEMEALPVRMTGDCARGTRAGGAAGTGVENALQCVCLPRADISTM
ncbi:hypothetical protein [Roseinatronobacter sp.]